MSDEAIREARSRRKAMYQAMIDVEEAVQAPTGTGIWGATLLEELGDLSQALEHHIETVEGPEGIIAMAVNETPRLDGHGKRLRAEHEALRRYMATAVDLTENAPVPITDGDAAEIRDAVLELMNGITRHRHHGSNFVWEAYDLDIGRGA